MKIVLTTQYNKNGSYTELVLFVDDCQSINLEIINYDEDEIETDSNQTFLSPVNILRIEDSIKFLKHYIIDANGNKVFLEG